MATRLTAAQKNKVRPTDAQYCESVNRAVKLSKSRRKSFQYRKALSPVTRSSIARAAGHREKNEVNNKLRRDQRDGQQLAGK